jgi:hypothetical protein
LDDDRQGLVELAAHGCKITNKLIGLFANDPSGVEVDEDTLHQVGGFEQRQGLFPFALGQRYFRFLRF